ncbi:MAG TPA: hypothetical protein VG733_08685, partial [Chthoniobacteraceae bacterium]|nr:hypothetical protein [Chthoniobacteraceae bacterium]
MSNSRVSTAAFLIAAALCFTPFVARADAPPNIPDRKATVALLVSAPWKFTGGPTWKGFQAIRIFDADGTFDTVNALSERGKWSISNNILVLSFEDGHTDRVPLPLNPDGCKGTDA